ncbi:MAG: hypothetical protein J1F32_01360 [Erysipelotrichales bacterium]|nr:hypothetical protein [Erysipelotrichales bacterium]
MSKRSKITIAYLIFLMVALVIPTITFTFCRYESNAEFSMIFRNDAYELFYEIRDGNNYLDSSGALNADEMFNDNSSIQVTSDKTIKDYRTAYGTEYIGWNNKSFTLSSVFGANRKTIVYTEAFEFTVTIDSGYIAEIYYLKSNRLEKTDDGEIIYETNADGEYIYEPYHATGSDFDLVDREGVPYVPANGGYPLGTEPTYDKTNDTGGGNYDIEVVDGPSACNLTYTGYMRDVSEVWKIVVVLIKKPKNPEPIFDARLWTNTVYSNGRCSWGEDSDPSYGNYPNVNSEAKQSNWQWGALKTDTQSMTKNEDPNSRYYGTYSYDLVFQTNSGDDFILDALEINGVPLNLPFVPMKDIYKPEHLEKVKKTTYGGDFAPTEEEGYDKCSLVTYISDGITSRGMRVTVTYLRAFTWSNERTQRVYRVLIEGARTNVIVTGGNVHTYQGAPEMIVYNLAGIADDAVIILANGNEYKEINSSVIVLNNNFAAIEKVKFKLKDYYENPYAKLTRKNGTTPIGDKIELDFELDDDGYYVIDLHNEMNALKSLGGGLIGLLSVRAIPIRYAIQYDLDTPEVSINDVYFLRQAEWFKNSYDNNNGKYYTVENTDTMRFHDFIPYDTTNNYLFSYWKAEKGEVDSDDYEEFEIRRSESFRFDRLLHFAKRFDINNVEDQRYDENDPSVPLYEDGIYIITVTAVWERQFSEGHDHDNLEDAYAEHYEEWSSMSFEEWYIECWDKWYSKYWEE